MQTDESNDAREKYENSAALLLGSIIIGQVSEALTNKLFEYIKLHTEYSRVLPINRSELDILSRDAIINATLDIAGRITADVDMDELLTQCQTEL